MAPTSLTFGIESGRGAGSRKGWDEDSPGRKEELIVVAAVGVVCTIRFGGRARTSGIRGRDIPILGSNLPTPQSRRVGKPASQRSASQF